MSVKQDRMADRILEILGELIMFEVTDPALRNVTVTKVVLDAELEYADVSVNALGDERRQKAVMQGLERANGYLRRELGARIRLRRTPNLVFHWDLTLEHVEKMERRLNELNITPAPVPPTTAATPSTDEEQDS